MSGLMQSERQAFGKRHPVYWVSIQARFSNELEGSTEPECIQG